MLTKLFPAFLGIFLAVTPAVSARTAPLLLNVSLEYRPAFQHNQETWDLYVYLDGDLLAWVPRGGQFAPTPEVRFVRQVEPGPHVVRLAAEKHERRSGGRWFHEARIVPVEIFFSLSAEGNAEMSLRVIGNTGLLNAGGARAVAQITQDGRVLQSVEQAIRSSADWPSLCEEIEVNLDPKRKKIPRKVRSELEQCVRWESLWRSLESPAGSRDDARALLERYDFQPKLYKRHDAR